eukprot:6189228-Pleurochrysis_carterae.AAC.2
MLLTIPTNTKYTLETASWPSADYYGAPVQHSPLFVYQVGVLVAFSTYHRSVLACCKMADLQMDSMPASSDAPHPSHTKQHRLSKQTPTVHQDEGAPGEQLISQSSGEGLSSCCPFNSPGFISRMLPSTGYSAGYNGRRATCRLHLFAILCCTALAALAIGPFAWGKWSKSPTMLEDDGLLSTSDFSAPLPTESTILVHEASTDDCVSNDAVHAKANCFSKCP